MRYNPILDKQLVLITDSQELKAILDDLEITQITDEITGALVDLDAAIDGDDITIWLTESSKPWSVYAEWERTGYYADASEEELDLQE